MNDFGEFPAELARLMAALQEESLNPAQRVRLAQLLREYPKAVQLYVHLTQLRVLLEEELGGGVPPVVPLMPPSIASHPGDGPAGRRAGGPFLANCRLDLGAGGRVAGVRPGRRRPADAHGDSDAIDWSDDGDAAPAPPSPPLTMPRPVRRRWWRWITLGAAAVFVLGAAAATLLIAAYGRGPRPPQAGRSGQLPPQQPADDSQTPPAASGAGHRPVATARAVAALGATENAVWAVDAVPARPARELTTTPLNLVSGLAEVLFKGGAVLVIEGPAEFTPETEDSVILKRGRLTARMPETARPFTVNTPAARVLDHGTEFGVDVGAGGTTVEVFHGRVSLKPGTAGDRGAEPVAVLAGTASRVGPSGRSTAPARPGSVAFIRQEEFEARLEERQRAPKSRWLAFSHQFRRDPDLVAYYPFDNAGEARDRLINRAAATRGTLDGKLPRTAAGNGPMWAAGRWPGTTSLQFNGEGQAVVIPYDPALDVGDALTIAAWVQNDAPQSHSPIVSRWPGAEGEGGAAYQMIVVGDAGLCPNALQLWIGLEPNLRLQFSPGPAERTTSWQFLAATFNARTKTKVFYSNGRCLGRVIGSRDMAAGAGHLYIGAEAPVTTSNTFFTGRITELCILKRAMSAEELRQMYEAGKPD